MRILPRSSFLAGLSNRPLRRTAAAPKRRSTASIVRTARIETLEGRHLLDGAFAWETFQTTSSHVEGEFDMSYFARRSALGSNGDVYFATPESNGIQQIRRAPSSVLTSNAPRSDVFPIVSANWKGLEDFDVNSRDDLVLSHRNDLFFSDAISYQNAGGDRTELMFDTQLPTASLTRSGAARPSLNHNASKFTVEYRDNFAIDPDSIHEDNIYIDGPQGRVSVTIGSVRWQGSSVFVEYLAMASDGMWDHTENGTYAVIVRSDSVLDVAGNAVQTVGLDAFVLDWDEPDESAERPEPVIVTSSGVSNSPSDSPRHLYLLEDNVVVSSDAMLMGATQVLFHSVVISDDGGILFSGEAFWPGRGPSSFIGQWGFSNNVHVRSIQDELLLGFRFLSPMQVSDSGQLIVTDGEQVLLFESDLSGHRVIADTTLFTGTLPAGRLRYGVVAISPDSKLAVFSVNLTDDDVVRFGGTAEALPTSGLRYHQFGMHLPSGLVFRIAGSSRDAFIDPGEHWQYPDGEPWRDISSENSGPAYIASIEQDEDDNYWIAYFQYSLYEPLKSWHALGGVTEIRAERLFVRRISIDELALPQFGPPVLLVSRNFSNAPYDRRQGGFADFAISPQGRFFGVHDVVIPSDIPHNHVDIERTFSSGVLPDFDSALLDDSSARHQVIERFARELGYWELRDPDSKYQRGVVLENGYVIVGMHVDEQSPGTFVAVELQPIEPEGPPVLISRGSELHDLLTTVWDQQGVGYSQFEDNRRWVLDWVERMAEVHDWGAILTGHSLGGALSQWFATEIASKTEHSIFEVVTFNSPGIAAQAVDSTADTLRVRLSEGATHYVVSGDFVSLSGEKFINGEAMLVTVGNGLLFDIDDLDPRPGFLNLDIDLVRTPRHSRPILVEQTEDYEGGITRQLDIFEITPIGIERLNHPEFNYMQDAAYRDFIINVAYDTVGMNAAHLVARQRAEEFRKRIPQFSAISIDHDFLARLAVGMLTKRTFLGKLWSLLTSDPSTNASPVFVTVNIEALFFDAGARRPTYDYENWRLIVSEGTPLIASVHENRRKVIFKHVETDTQLSANVPLGISSRYDTVNVLPPPRLAIGNHQVSATGILTTYSRLTVTGDIPVHFPEAGFALVAPPAETLFLMHSKSPLVDRFPQTAISQSQEMNVALVGVLASESGTADAQWFIRMDESWIAFVPKTDDRLLAMIEAESQSIDSLLGRKGEIHGVQAGYYSGDLSFEYLPDSVAAAQSVQMQGTGFSVSENFVLTNLAQPNDVNGDGKITAQDALTIINYLSSASLRPPANYLDVNMDRRISAADALIIINTLASGNFQASPVSGELISYQSAVAVDPVAEKRTYNERSPAAITMPSFTHRTKGNDHGNAHGPPTRYVAESPEARGVEVNLQTPTDVIDFVLTHQEITLSSQPGNAAYLGQNR